MGGFFRAHAAARVRDRSATGRRRILGLTKRAAARVRDRSGQATVEAAFLAPILLGGVLLLVQPGVVLYDLVVMQGAAMEGCRVLATSSDVGDGGLCEEYVRRRLGAIPPHDFFHVHEGGCTWEITFSGSESEGEVGVTVATEARPLPLIDFIGRAVGLVGEEGTMRIEVSATMATQPAWALEATAGSAPADWVGAWLS